MYPVDVPPWLLILNWFFDCVDKVKDHKMCKEMSLKIGYGGTVEWRWHEAWLTLLLDQERGNVEYKMDMEV